MDISAILWSKLGPCGCVMCLISSSALCAVGITALGDKMCPPTKYEPPRKKTFFTTSTSTNTVTLRDVLSGVLFDRDENDVKTGAIHIQLTDR